MKQSGMAGVVLDLNAGCTRRNMDAQCLRIPQPCTSSCCPPCRQAGCHIFKPHNWSTTDPPAHICARLSDDNRCAVRHRTLVASKWLLVGIIAKWSGTEQTLLLREFRSTEGMALLLPLDVSGCTHEHTQRCVASAARMSKHRLYLLLSGNEAQIGP